MRNQESEVGEILVFAGYQAVMGEYQVVVRHSLLRQQQTTSMSMKRNVSDEDAHLLWVRHYDTQLTTSKLL